MGSGNIAFSQRLRNFRSSPYNFAKAIAHIKSAVTGAWGPGYTLTPTHRQVREQQHTHLEKQAMSSRGLNLCTLAGNVAADPEIRHIERKDGGTAQLARMTIYVDRIPSRKENDSFTVSIDVWEDSAGWRKLNYVKKGSLIIASGTIDASPYIAKGDSQARAGLQLKATDIFLDSSPRTDQAA